MNDEGVVLLEIARNSPISSLNIHLIVFVLIMLLMGPVLNVGIIGAILRSKSLYNAPNIFVINLCSADLCLCLIIGSTSIIGLWKPDILKAHSIICRFIANLCIIICLTSIITHTVIAVTRYLKIRHPSKIQWLTKKRAVLMSCMIWVAAFFLQCGVNFWQDGIVYEEKLNVCFWNRKLLKTRTYLGCLLIFPLIVIVPIYFKLKKYLRQNLIGQNIRKSQKNMVKVMMLHFTVICIAWGQFACIFIFDRNDRLSAKVYTISLQIAHSISVLGPLVYWTFPGFKLGIFKFYGKKFVSTTTIAVTRTHPENSFQAKSKMEDRSKQ